MSGASRRPQLLTQALGKAPRNPTQTPSDPLLNFPRIERVPSGSYLCTANMSATVDYAGMSTNNITIKIPIKDSHLLLSPSGCLETATIACPSRPAHPLLLPSLQPRNSRSRERHLPTATVALVEYMKHNLGAIYHIPSQLQ